MKSINLPIQQEDVGHVINTVKIAVGISPSFFTPIEYSPAPIAIIILLIVSLFFPPAFADDHTTSGKTYAQFNAQGELIRPTGYREWIFVGTPLTPNDMNNGKAAIS